MLYQTSLASEAVHIVQHLCFLVSALLFWWVVLAPAGQRVGLGVLLVFTTAVHTSILGALLTFSPTAWYPGYEVTAWWWGLTLLEDQQLGGLIMGVPAGVVYVIAALFLLGSWLQRAERRSLVTAAGARVPGLR